MNQSNQPDPIPNDLEPSWEAVIRDLERGPWIHTDLVIADARARDQFGFSKYNVRLQPFNGRDPLLDAYAEYLDGAVYLKNAVREGQVDSQLYYMALDIMICIRGVILRRDGK